MPHEPPEFSSRFFVISGAPGAGKTTLLLSLENRRSTVMEKGARAIIRTRSAIGGTALPWKNQEAYAELMLGWELRSYNEALRLHQPILFDRAIPDIIAHLELCGLPVQPNNTATTRPYSSRPTGPKSTGSVPKDASRPNRHKPPAKPSCRYTGAWATNPHAALEKHVQFVMEHIMNRQNTARENP